MWWSYRQKHMIITLTYLNSHLFGAPCEYVLHGFDPGLDWASCWSPWPIQYRTVYSNGSDFSLTPSFPSGRLLTNVQVNNITMLHGTLGHTYIHHIVITILLLFYTSSTLLGRPAGPDPSRLTHWESPRTPQSFQALSWPASSKRELPVLRILEVSLLRGTIFYYSISQGKRSFSFIFITRNPYIRTLNISYSCTK
jgi:hypothetical protein